MTTDELRRQLDRIADTAPAADVPGDTWTRARRSVLRDRAAVGAAAAAVVAVIGGLAVWLPQRDGTPPVATTESGAIPSRIWTAPDDLKLAIETDLAVGPVSAAYLGSVGDTGGYRLVAVSANDGSYHSLLLPGPDGTDAVRSGSGDQVFMLSPDGRRLAYVYRGAQGDGGVAVADLVDGSLRLVPLDIGKGVLVRRLIWSPGGTHLVWWGQPRVGKGFGNTMAGLIAPGATTSVELPEERRQDEVRNYAVDDAGRVFLIDNYRVRTWRNGEIVATRPVDLGSTYSLSAQIVGDNLVEVRAPFASDDLTDAGTLFVRSEAAGTMTVPFPVSLFDWSVLGWTTAGEAIVLADADDGAVSDPDVYLVPLSSEATTPEQIVSLESTLPPDALTVATDLPVQDFDAPDWAEEPWWRTHVDVVIGLVVAAALAALMGLRWLWRRYRYRAAM